MKTIRHILFGLSFCATAIANEYNLSANSNCDTHSFNTGYDLNAKTWYSLCDNITISGEYICSSQNGAAGTTTTAPPLIDTTETAGTTNMYCWCKLTAPFVGNYWVSTGHSAYHELFPEDSEKRCLGELFPLNDSCAWRCSRLWGQTNSGYNLEYGHHGYYTEENLTKFKTALFTATLEKPCEIGISKLVTSTGLSFQLWAEKYTEPALIVQYNNQKCYAKTEPGQASSTLNIKINNEIYHLID